jgi:hypothetical protein
MGRAGVPAAQLERQQRGGGRATRGTRVRRHGGCGASSLRAYIDALEREALQRAALAGARKQAPWVAHLGVTARRPGPAPRSARLIAPKR